jgi:peptide/nickel transport system substrate-binding protein
MNDLLVENRVVIPLVNRPQVTAVSSKLKAYLSGWDNNTGHLKDWYREA